MFQVKEKVHVRFFIALILFDLYKESPVWEVSEKYRVDRGLVQSMLQSAISFASCVYYFSLVRSVTYDSIACLLTYGKRRLV